MSIHAIVAGNTAHIGQEAFLQIGSDEGTAAFGAEDAMEEAAGKGMAEDDFSAD
jgi:hypothetical protein